MRNIGGPFFAICPKCGSTAFYQSEKTVFGPIRTRYLCSVCKYNWKEDEKK